MEESLYIKYAIAGSMGGLAQCLVGHPFDTAKVKMQTDTIGKYKSMMNTFKIIKKEEGRFALYRGLQSPIISMMFFNALAFSSYQQTKKYLVNYKYNNISNTSNTSNTSKNNNSSSSSSSSSNAKDAPSDNDLTSRELFLCGGIAGIVFGLVESPADLVKCQLQVNYQKYNGFLNCCKQIYANNGVVGIYQGFSATLLRNIPSNAFYFGIYDETKRLIKRKGGDPTDMTSSMIAGGVGGLSRWIFTYPTDVIKSKIQSDTTTNIKSQRKYPTIFITVQRIYSEQGLKGFYKGFVPCIARSVPANAACFLAFEQCLIFLGAKEDHPSESLIFDS